MENIMGIMWERPALDYKRLQSNHSLRTEWRRHAFPKQRFASFDTYKMNASESLMVFCTNLLHLTGVEINVLKKGKYNIGFRICWFSINRENMDSFHVYRVCVFLYCHCSRLTLHDMCLKGMFA